MFKQIPEKCIFFVNRNFEISVPKASGPGSAVMENYMWKDYDLERSVML